MRETSQRNAFIALLTRRQVTAYRLSIEMLQGRASKKQWGDLKGRDAQIPHGLSSRNDLRCRARNDTCYERNPIVDRFNRCSDKLVIFVSGQDMTFASAATSRQPMHATLDQPIDLRLHGGEVNLSLLIERCGERCDDSFKPAHSHLSCLASGLI